MGSFFFNFLSLVTLMEGLKVNVDEDFYSYFHQRETNLDVQT